MPLTALPMHLQTNNSMAAGRGTDWDQWIQKYIPQHWFAFGPNAEKKWDFITLLPVPVLFKLAEIDFTLFGKPFTLTLPAPVKWIRLVFPIPVLARWRRFPILLLGFGVTRWMSQNDKKRIIVHNYKNRFQSSLFGKRTGLKVTLSENGNEDDEKVFELENLEGFGPSPIQYWSPIGFQVTWPLHVAFQIQWGWSKIHQSYKRKIFFRAGFRWDSGDDYHDGPSFFLGGSFN